MVGDSKNVEYKFDLNGYKHFLIDDFKKNSKMAELALTLSFTNAPSMEAWIKGIAGKDFFEYRQSSPFQPILPDDFVAFVDGIHYQTQYFLHDEKDLYQFFTQKEYNSYEDLVQRDNHGYYVYDINFFKKIDKLLFDKLMANDNYVKIPKSKGIYKQLKKDIVLRLESQKYNKHTDVIQYNFPNVILCIEGKDFPLLNCNSETDIRTLLLLTSKSFVFFYFVSSVFSKPGEVPESVLLKKDEPIIKISESKFILTNSESKLKIFNKYIYFTLELYYHYFKVLEKYVITTV